MWARVCKAWLRVVKLGSAWSDEPIEVRRTSEKLVALSNYGCPGTRLLLIEPLGHTLSWVTTMPRVAQLRIEGAVPPELWKVLPFLAGSLTRLALVDGSSGFISLKSAPSTTAAAAIATLKGLRELRLAKGLVKDAAPLRSLPLQRLRADGLLTADTLAAFAAAGMPLTHLTLDLPVSEKEAAVLARFTQLESLELTQRAPPHWLASAPQSPTELAVVGVVDSARWFADPLLAQAVASLKRLRCVRLARVDAECLLLDWLPTGDGTRALDTLKLELLDHSRQHIAALARCPWLRTLELETQYHFELEDVAPLGKQLTALRLRCAARDALHLVESGVKAAGLLPRLCNLHLDTTRMMPRDRLLQFVQKLAEHPALRELGLGWHASRCSLDAVRELVGAKIAVHWLPTASKDW